LITPKNIDASKARKRLIKKKIVVDAKSFKYSGSSFLGKIFIPNTRGIVNAAQEEITLMATSLLIEIFISFPVV
jgi:hypothetical protein